MREIVIISGKGGTGKTSLTASFAVLAKNKVIVDCDVDAADLHLLLHPKIVEREDFYSGKKARINKERCIDCGKCLTYCRFGAVKATKDGNGRLEKIVIDPIECEGCGLCKLICPVDAIEMEENLSGEWFISETFYGPFVHAKLGIAEENSGKLVSKIRQIAKEIAERERLDYIIIDGPPGIGCPVIASLSGVDLAVIVTEPTPSGIHDLIRVAEVARYFKIKTKVVINKFDLNLENSNKIETECNKMGIEVLGYIPFSLCVSKAIVEGIPPVNYCRNEVAKETVSIWEKIEKQLKDI